MLPSSPFYSGHDGTQSKVLVSNSEAKFWFTLTMGKLPRSNKINTKKFPAFRSKQDILISDILIYFE